MFEIVSIRLPGISHGRVEDRTDSKIALSQKNTRQHETHYLKYVVISVTLAMCLFSDAGTEANASRVKVSNTNSVGSTSFTPMTAMEAVYKVAEKKSSALTVTGFIDRLSHKAIKDFEIRYELRKASDSWNLVINLSSGSSPAIKYLVQMDETGSVMKAVNLDGSMSDRQQTKRIQKKEKRDKKKRGNLRDELLTVSVKQQSLLSGSAGMTKVLDFFTNGVLRTEFSIPHDEKVVTFFQLPVFASTMTTVASAGFRLRCAHEGKPHPVILKRELTKDGYRIDVYKDDFIDSEQSKRIIQCVYSNHEGFSFPDEIALEIDDATISVQKQANKELTNE